MSGKPLVCSTRRRQQQQRQNDNDDDNNDDDDDDDDDDNDLAHDSAALCNILDGVEDIADADVDAFVPKNNPDIPLCT